jgi:branched-chain amino acid transport system permease protein
MLSPATMLRRAAARARTRLWGGRVRNSPGAQRYRRSFGTLAALALAWCVEGCAEADVEQLRICERLIPAIEAEGARIELVRGVTDPGAANAVRVEYRVVGPNGAPDGSWISCRFGGSGFERDRLRLTGVVTAREGALSEIGVFMLRRYWLDLYEAQRTFEDGSAGGGGSWSRDFLYFLQLGVNGITLGCLYGLLAIGYTLVYSIIGRINLAFGEIAIIGAYTTFLAVTALALLGLGPLPLALLAVLALVAVVGATYGLATERVVFRPLREVPSQAPLIATLGLAIFLQEALRLLQGAEDRWVQPVFSAAHDLGATPGFALTVNTSQILIVGLSGALYGALWLVMSRTRFGRAARACADDVAMAGLCGVNVGRTVALTFALGAAYAAIAGFVVLLRYGGASFHDGFLLGFKALTAAIVGGIGSVPGAMLGGLLIGALEIFWGGYLNLEYRDVATFALLAVVLIWRPHGLLGQPVRLANDVFRQRPI